MTPWTIASGMVIPCEIRALMRVAKLACIGSLPPIPPMSGIAKIGPKATIAPKMCSQSSHGNQFMRASIDGRDAPAEAGARLLTRS